MKIQSLAPHLATLLTEYYINLKNVTLSDDMIAYMISHLKQSIVNTYKYLFGMEDVMSIDIYQHPSFDRYELPEYDDNEYIHEMMLDMKNRLYHPDPYHTICKDDVIIDIHDVPFEGLYITIRDILDLFDLDRGTFQTNHNSIY